MLRLTELESAPPELKDAFMGAMLMKKAGLGGIPANKLKTIQTRAENA